MKSALRGFLASVLILLASVNTSTASSGDEPPKLQIQVSSNGHGTPIKEGQSVVLGAMVTNSMATQLRDYHMTVQFDGDQALPIAVDCKTGTVLPGAKKPCTAEFKATSAQIFKGRITGRITVTATDPKTTKPYVATAIFATGHEDVPPTVLLPTQLYADGTTPKENGYNPAGSAPALNVNLTYNKPDFSHPLASLFTDHLSLQPITGRDKTSESGDRGGVQCNVNSQRADLKSQPTGVLCAGQGQQVTDPNGIIQTAIALNVPSPTLVVAPMPVSISTPCQPLDFSGNQPVVCSDGFPSYVATLMIAPVDPSGKRNNSWEKVRTIPLCKPVEGSYKDVLGFTRGNGKFACSTTTPQLTIGLTHVNEDVIFCVSKDSAFGGSCTTPYEVRVEPTTIVKTQNQLQKIVYAPPGDAASGATQAFTVSEKSASTSAVSFGNSSSYSSSSTIGVSVSAESSQCAGDGDVNGVCLEEKLELSASLTAGQSNSDETTTTRIQTTSLGTDKVVSASPITHTLNDDDVDPYQPPPWLGDTFHFFANPNYAIWDLSLCSSGYSSWIDDGTINGSIKCPEGTSIIARTTALPLIKKTNAVLTAQTLVKCYDPTGESDGGYNQANIKLSSSDCAQLLAQDPFAGTALGLIPTPVGETPGQSVNPARVLAQSGATATEFEYIVAGAGSTGYTKSLTAESIGQLGYSASSTQEQSISEETSNSAAIGVKGSVTTGMFSGHLGVSVSVSATQSNSTTMAVNFSKIQDTENSQSFANTYTVVDPTYNLSVHTWLDPRFDTVMFQMADTPSIKTHNLASVSLRSAVPAGKVSKLSLSVLPLPGDPSLPIVKGSILTWTSSTGKSASFKVAKDCTFVQSVQNCPVTGSAISGLTVGTRLTIDNLLQFSVKDDSATTSLDGPAVVSFCTSDAKNCTPKLAKESSDGNSFYVRGSLRTDGLVVLQTFAGQDGISDFPLNATPYALNVLSITKVTLAAATRGRTYHPTTFKVKGATMGTTLVWSATNLPRGLKLSSGGTLSGVPVSSLRPGTTTLMVKVTQSEGTKRTIATLPILLRVA